MTIPHSPSAKPLSNHDTSAKASRVWARKMSSIWGMRCAHAGTTIRSIVRLGALCTFPPPRAARLFSFLC
jgi:hypothetical protein